MYVPNAMRNLTVLPLILLLLLNNTLLGKIVETDRANSVISGR